MKSCPASNIRYKPHYQQDLIMILNIIHLMLGSSTEISDFDKFIKENQPVETVSQSRSQEADRKSVTYCCKCSPTLLSSLSPFNSFNV